MSGEYSPLGQWGRVAWALVLALAPATGSAEPATESGVSAAPPRAEVEILWRDIVEAVDRHPSVAAGQHQRAAARAAVDAAGAVPNPSLEVTAGYGRARDGSTSRVEWGVELTLPMGWLARRGASVDAAQAHAGAVAAETQAWRREALVELHGLFWSLVYAQERVAALDELSQQTVILASTVRRRVDAGESRPVDAARVEVEEEKVAGELAAARSTLDARRQELVLWLQLPPGRSPTAIADLKTLPRPMSASAARSRVQTRHPALAAASARVQALAADVAVERRARAPEVALGVFADSELDRSAYGVKLSVDLPLWNWNSGSIQRAESELAAGRNRLRAERLRVESTAVELQASCQASVTLAARYRDRILPRATQAARGSERSYDLGESNLLEVIDARRTFLETRTELVIALARAHNDCGRLAILLGGEAR